MPADRGNKGMHGRAGSAERSAGPLPGKISRRSFLGGAAALSGALSLGSALEACGSGPGSLAGTTTIDSWDWWVSQSPWLNNEIKLFEQAHNKIQVKRTINAVNGYDRLFTLAERSGSVPDVFMLTTVSVPLNEQVSRGWLLPLDRWATGSWQRLFPPYTFVEGSNVFGGKLYTAPLTRPAPWAQLYINTKVFKAAGLTNSDGSIKIPQTWDDVTRFAETITSKSRGSTYGLGFGNGSFSILPWWVEVFVRAAGSPGGSVGPDLRTGKYTFGSDRNYQDFAQLLLQWNRKGYVYPGSTSISDEIARAYFERGRFGMTVGGVWNQPGWTQQGFLDYTLTTLIGPTAQRRGYFYSSPGGSTIAISARTGHPEQAWSWFNWFYSPDAGRRWVQQYNEDLSVHTQYNDPSKVHFAPFAKYVALRDLSIPGPVPSVRNKEEAFVVVNPVQPDFGTVMTGIYTGQIKDVRSALSDLDGRLQNALSDGIKQARQQGHKVDISDYVFPDWNITKPYEWSIPEYP
jgi:ABC-type glycerol-3-phosphate transport system substrate-binding protein